MNTEAFYERCRAILAALPDTTRSLWDYTAQQGRSSDWLYDLLARIVLLIGEDEPRVVDASLDDQGGPHGFLMVVTDFSIVRASFVSAAAPGAYTAVDATVEAIPRSAVKRVRAVVATTGQPEGAWPRNAQIIVDLDRDLCGSASWTIPENALTRRDAGAIARVASELARESGR